MPTVAEYTRIILSTEAQVREWKRRRKALILSAKAKRQHRDPTYAARFRAGHQNRIADPLLNAWRIEKIRRTHLAKPNALPSSFTGAIRNKMYRMIAAGASREDAIAALLAKPSTGVSPRVPPVPREGAPSPKLPAMEMAR